MSEIKRYDIRADLRGIHPDAYLEVDEVDDGDWVKHSDALAAIAAAEQRGRLNGIADGLDLAATLQGVGEGSPGSLRKRAEDARVRALAFPPASGSEAKKEEQP